MMFSSRRSMEFRERMVIGQIAARGIRDERVLSAMMSVPREFFTPSMVPLETVYGDYPLSIGYGQTISQPYIVALMVGLLGLTPGDRVLEIGTGSGYQAAILAAMDLDVVTVELIPALQSCARQAVMKSSPGSSVRFIVADGFHGWSPGAPYGGIIVSAAPPELPEHLVEQLDHGGCIIIPVGRYSQRLVRVTRLEDGSPYCEDLLGVRFVPLIEQS